MEVKQVLFIQGGGNDGYEADEALVSSLKQNLGNKYQVDYPEFNQTQLHQILVGRDKLDGIFIE